MSKINDGGAAFPVVIPGIVYGDGSSEAPYVDDAGMSLRAWLAGMAMQGCLANPSWNVLALSAAGLSEFEAVRAMPKMAVMYADLMIAELEKGAASETQG